MHVGHTISGLGHLGLIGWLFLGGMFAAEPDPVELTEVSVISGADFDALVAAAAAPPQVSEVAQPVAPNVPVDVPDVTTVPDRAIVQPAPIRSQPPENDPTPDVPEQALPPVTEVDDTAPVLEEPVGDVAVLVPLVAPQAVPRPVDRVAPEPVALPSPDANPDVAQQEAVVPDAQAEPTPRDAQEARAPEEATTEIATEATAAPARSIRPPGRRPAPAPARPAQTAESTPQENDVDADAIAAAVAAAQVDAPTPAAPSGPPLSAGEKESLRVAVSSCWNVGSLSSEALQTTVTISVAMNSNGTPVVGSISLDGSSGGSSTAARQAFEAARRAIIRCGARGFDLPAEKYGQWQNIEMTFNPERMRVK